VGHTLTDPPVRELFGPRLKQHASEGGLPSWELVGPCLKHHFVDGGLPGRLPFLLAPTTQSVNTGRRSPVACVSKGWTSYCYYSYYYCHYLLSYYGYLLVLLQQQQRQQRQHRRVVLMFFWRFSSRLCHLFACPVFAELDPFVPD
jgi:hypothetical protein